MSKIIWRRTHTLARAQTYYRPVGTSWPRRIAEAVRADWVEVGSLGRLAFIGIALSLIVTIILGFSIESAVRRHLLTARVELITNIVDEIEVAHPGLPPAPDTAAYQAFDQSVRLLLLGGETLRVKLWAPDGTVVYSDDENLIGSRFDLSPAAVAALNGDPTPNISDASDPAHADERAVSELIEFYVPYHDAHGAVIGAFEVEQQVDTLNDTLTHVGRSVWITIGSGLLLLGAFMLSLLLARARAVNRRRRHVESLVGELLTVQEEERRRIVGALHDDIGQPLYRLLYGLEGGKARLPEDSPVREELDNLEGIVRGVDSTLRSELRLLHRGLAEDLGLEAALTRLVDATRDETGLTIDLSFDVHAELEPVPRTALLRAAQEALINVRKHAGATGVSVVAREEGKKTIIEVSDDGSGVKGPEGLGLTTTRERLESIGGGVELEPMKEGGTMLRAWVPTPRKAT